MTAEETIEKDPRAAEIYRQCRALYIIEKHFETPRINEMRVYFTARMNCVVYHRPFPWLFKVPKKHKDILPWGFRDSEERAELYLKEMILFNAGFYFETKEHWFNPVYAWLD